MITQKRYDELAPRYTAFTAAATAYKALLDANELPFNIDVTGLLFAYKTGLFTKLVAVDKGRKLQYDMLKAAEAKQALIDATIDLTGYDITTELTTALDELHETLTAANGAIRAADGIDKPTVGTLFANHRLDVAEYLKGYVIDWAEADRSTVLDMVNQYAEVLTSLDNMLRGCGIKWDSTSDAHRHLADLVALNTGTVAVNELAVYNMLEGAKHRAKTAEVVARKAAAVRELNRAQDEAGIAAARKRAQETEAFLRARNNQ
jgi:hypothetical protein